MRIAVMAAVLCLGGCASERLALAPPATVDLSGHWQLNEADSDDPQRVLQTQLPGGAGAGQSSSGPSGGRGGRQGGRGGGAGGGGGGGPGGPAGGATGYGAPSAPVVGALSEELRWPGKQLDIKQVAGVVAFTSEGRNFVYSPSVGDKQPKRPRSGDEATGRDAPGRHRGEGPAPISGWDDKTLEVQKSDPEGDHPPFVERYSLSQDGQRLIEVVGFKGWRGGGFTMSRVWDRVTPDAAPSVSADRPGTH